MSAMGVRVREKKYGPERITTALIIFIFEAQSGSIPRLNPAQYYAAQSGSIHYGSIWLNLLQQCNTSTKLPTTWHLLHATHAKPRYRHYGVTSAPNASVTSIAAQRLSQDADLTEILSAAQAAAQRLLQVLWNGRGSSVDYEMSQL